MRQYTALPFYAESAESFSRLKGYKMPTLKLSMIIKERIHALPDFRQKHCRACGEEIFAVVSGGKVVTVDMELCLHQCKGGSENHERN
jgi:hypothetical protein